MLFERAHNNGVLFCRIFFLSLRIFWSRTTRKNHQKIKTLQNFSCYSEKKKIRKKGEKRETN